MAPASGIWGLFFPVKAFALACHGAPVLGHFCAFPTCSFTLYPNKVFSCYLTFPAPLRTFEWADQDQELLEHSEKRSECVGTLLDAFGRAGQREAAIWPVSLVLGGASSLSGAQHAV